MELQNLQSHWNAWGERDPFWAILSDPAKKDGGWNVDEFFQTGKNWMDRVMRYVETLHLPLARNKALDFGCGVGRLTQALCSYFQESVGIDIAESMIGKAQRFNKHGDRCRYYMNSRNDLSLFDDGSFDFVYSILVLQHMPHRYSQRYIAEFLRILAPGGLIVFQLPTESLASEGITKCGGQSTISEPLPDSAFRAGISISDLSHTMEAGSQQVIRMRVRNLSDTTWPMFGTAEGDFRIKIGNHWFDEKEKTVVEHDSQAVLPHDVTPGSEILVTQLITAPTEPGSYFLEIDLVQQGIAWFKVKGSLPQRIRVDVTASIKPGFGQRSSQNDSPVIHMYGMPRQEVVKFVFSCGARIIDIRQDDMGGKYWLSNTYYLTK
jgi:SAM-dependent methyltransferase